MIKIENTLVVLLRRVGWSQAFFAQHINRHEKTVNRWCNGTPDPTAVKYLELMVRLMGL